MNASIRALSLLIRSFLETSINPKFQHSLLVHGLVDCPYIMGVGQALLGAVQQVLPDLGSEKAVLLYFRPCLLADENIAVHCILVSGTVESL